MSYHLQSSMDFRSNRLGYGQRACILCWNEAISHTCVFPRTGINVVHGVLTSWPLKTRFHFSECRNVVFLWSGNMARTRVERNPCTIIEEHLHNMFHTPAPRASSPGSCRAPAVSRRCCWKRAEFKLRAHFSLPRFSGKIIFSCGTGHFTCPSFSVSRASQQANSAALDAAKRDVRCVPFWAQLIQKKKSEKHETFTRRHSMWPNCEEKIKVGIR
jgi:hypothetical protein